MARVTTRIPGPGPRDESPRDEYGTDYRGAHRRPDEDADYEYAEYEEYEEYEDPDHEGAGYEGAGYEGGSDYAEGNYINEEPEGAEYADVYEDADDRGAAAAPAGSTAVAAGGVPKRGLAMILIAVGALLLLWGIYALTQRDGGNSDADGAATQTSTVATDTVATDTATAPVATDTVATGTATAPVGQATPANPAAPASPADAANPSANAGQNGQNAQATAPAPAPSGPALTAGDAQVFVYNNSGIPNAATDTAKRLDQQYAIANNSPDPAAMNMPEQNYGVFPETYVFYNPQVNGAEQIAADVARRVGGTPRAVGDLPQGAAGLPSAATGRNAITVVIAG